MTSRLYLTDEDAPELFIGGVSQPHSCPFYKSSEKEVAVLTAKKPVGNRRIGRIDRCDYAVLVRDPTAEEKEFCQNGLSTLALQCVELIVPAIEIDNAIFFRRTGLVEPYVNI